MSTFGTSNIQTCLECSLFLILLCPSCETEVRIYSKATCELKKQSITGKFCILHIYPNDRLFLFLYIGKECRNSVHASWNLPVDWFGLSVDTLGQLEHDGLDGANTCKWVGLLLLTSTDITTICSNRHSATKHSAQANTSHFTLLIWSVISYITAY